MPENEKTRTVMKSFGFTISKKFPDDSIIVQHFGTNIEQVCNIEEDVEKLRKDVYMETIKDFKIAQKKDPMTQSLVITLTRQLKNERKREDNPDGV